MHKIFLTIFLPILLFIYILFLVTDFTPKKYPQGRDTAVSFGDGTFQIIRDPDRSIALVDNSIQGHWDDQVIEPNVSKYRRQGKCIYVVGESGYTVLNYETGELRQYRSLDELTDQEQKVFRKILE